SDGRVIKDGSDWKYEFWLKDHLGNIRVTFVDEDDDGLISASEVRSRNDYYSFGMEWNGAWRLGESKNPKNNYKFNGKEQWQEMNLGLANLLATFLHHIKSISPLWLSLPLTMMANVCSPG
ncbi:MAG: hypothetical protein WBO36_01580, partial [Saprospiraceae bacterium]